jgi:hypothetical protein
MKLPYKKNGLRYGHGPDCKRVCLGAYMGRPDMLPDDQLAPIKLHLRRVPFVDSCYDQGGAYWGCPANLWCAWSGAVEVYVRADSRQAAKEMVGGSLPNARFYR